jgi:hypothetical protein
LEVRKAVRDFTAKHLEARMAVRFNKRIKIAPGIKLNLSRSGVSTTIGGKGASVNIGKKGTHLNAGIPGTGLSTRTKIRDAREASAPPKKSSTALIVIVLLVAIGIALLIF